VVFGERPDAVGYPPRMVFVVFLPYVEITFSLLVSGVVFGERPPCCCKKRGFDIIT
jgi:hypothetical protein